MGDYSPKVDFDSAKGRVSMDGEWVVLHCQHFNLGFVQMVLDAAEYIDAGSFMSRSAEENTIRQLGPYKAATPEETLDTAHRMFSFLGYGKLDLSGLNESGGEAVAAKSHIGNGWQVKYTKPAPRPVDFFTQGFIAGALAIAYGKPVGTYKVTQTAEIAMGDPQSVFKVEVS